MARWNAVNDVGMYLDGVVSMLTCLSEDAELVACNYNQLVHLTTSGQTGHSKLRFT